MGPGDLPREKGEPGRTVEAVEVDGEALVRDGELLQPEKVFSVVSNEYLVGLL